MRILTSHLKSWQPSQLAQLSAYCTVKYKLLLDAKISAEKPFLTGMQTNTAPNSHNVRQYTTQNIYRLTTYLLTYNMSTSRSISNCSYCT